MRYVYPAILFPDDNKVSVTVPDLPGCYTFGDDMADALIMAKDAIEMWLWDAENNGEAIPPASENLEAGESQTITLIVADTDVYRREHDTRSVKKTLSLPNWLNSQAEKANAPFSQILQEGLKDYLGLQEQPHR